MKCGISLSGLLIVMTAAFISCTSGGNAGGKDSAGDSAYIESGEGQSVADNDIAMTVRSIADAINYGEKLDSVSYTYSGILTDGRSRPLYTDFQGRPGEWDIRVVSPEMVVIRNLYTGDLLTDALKGYISGVLGLDDTMRMPVAALPGSDDVREEVYDFGRGYIKFKVRKESRGEHEGGEFIEITLVAKPGS